MLPRRTLEDRFWEKVDRTDEHSCWAWKAALDPHGYGRIGKGSKTYFAHRISWEIHHSSIPDGLAVLHKCDNPACVNPHHLFLGTQEDNMQDMKAKCRGKLPQDIRMCGERNGSSKLNDTIVAEIRKLTGVVSQRELAARYGISAGHVSRIQTGRRWRDVAA